MLRLGAGWGVGRWRAASTVFAIAVFGAGAARADQFVVLDSTWEHTADLPDSHFHVDPLPATPADWTSPVDYASGTAYLHLEVYTKPTDTPTKFQVCFEGTPTYACTDQSPTYTAVGVYDWSTPFSSFWSPPNEAVDWSQGTNKLAVILKDTQNGKPSADNVGAATAALYTPTQVRMVVTIVAPGSDYVPPGPADAGAPTDAGGDGGGSSGDGGADAGTPGPDAAGPGGSGGSAPVAPAATASGDDGGCGVAPRGVGADYFALGIAGAALAAKRRRRRT